MAPRFIFVFRPVALYTVIERVKSRFCPRSHKTQRRRAIEALEARAPPLPDSVATLVNSLQNRVNSITSVRNFERKNWENSPRDTMHSD